MTSLREWLNARPAVAGGIVALGVAALLVFHSRSRRAVPLPTFPTMAYYSSDDGATYFTDKINKATPFDKDGRPAFGAHVFSADNGQHLWVGYLEKSGNTFTGYVKEPGKGEWVPLMSAAGTRLVAVKSPPGMDTGTVNEIFP